MIIRKGNFSDLAAMRRLFTDTISSVCKNDYNIDQINAWKSGADNDEKWLKVMEHQLVMVAEIKGQITGFCTQNHGNYIDLLFVHKDFQHQGIAGKLYTFIEQEARHQNQKVLTADVSKTAKPFFEKMGFTVIREQTVHVKGTDLINYQMQKELN